MTRMRPATWLTGAFLLALLLLALSTTSLASTSEERAGAFVIPITTTLRDAAQPVTDVLLHAGQLQQLTAENAQLRRDLARTEAELATVREQRTAMEQATALLDTVGADSGQFIPASVVMRDPSLGSQLLLINRGSEDGVAAGQPVLGAGSTLVGIVDEVGQNRARVRLLTDRTSSVSAIVQSSRTPGSLDGTGDGLQLNFVDAATHVAVGDAILTGALGGLLPPGLLIGRVTAISTNPEDLFPVVTVEPLASFDRLEQVLVMTSFAPGAELPLDGGATP